MFAKPLEQHRWLEQLVGDWRVAQECSMPDGPKQTVSEMTCRMIGGLWLVSENKGKTPEGGDWTCIMTLGFDPKQEAYVGTFVGSMMTQLWQYKGQVDESGKRLPLSARGPSMDGTREANYRDSVEIISADQWRFSSEIEQENGEWMQLLNGTHTRVER